MLDLDSFSVSSCVLVDYWWKLKHSSEPPRAGRPALLTDPEVITLASLAHYWPRFRSEQDTSSISSHEASGIRDRCPH